MSSKSMFLLFFFLVISVLGDDPSCPGGTINTQDNKCYIFVNKTAGWQAAFNDCHDNEMELAWPRNAYENALMYTLIPDQIAQNIWLGVYQPTINGPWQDIYKYPIKYWYWASGEPNTHVASAAKMKFTGAWVSVSTVPDAETYNYICRSL